MTVRYRGHAGHFIASNACLFHLHASVPGYRISTVGDYHPQHLRTGEAGVGRPKPIGPDRYYETAVFREDANGTLIDGPALEDIGYQTASEAEAGHHALVAKYAAIAASPHASVRSGPKSTRP